jgi:hypothetical protein
MSDDDRVRVAAHELAHALTGRAQGWRIRSVSILPGASTKGTCEHHPRTDLGPFEAALGDTVTLLAGEMGEWIRPRSGWHEPSDDEADIDRAAAVALAALPRDEAAFIAWSRTAPSTGDDASQAEELAEIAGAERYAFLHFAGARARRFVTELAPLIAALIPILLTRQLMSGDDIEAAIHDLADTSAANLEGSQQSA